MGGPPIGRERPTGSGLGLASRRPLFFRDPPAEGDARVDPRPSRRYAVVKALRHFGVFAGLKYPNDAVYQDRKIAGILSEGVYRRETYHVIIGIGVNTNVDLDRLPPDVQPTATTLKREVNLFVANDEFLDYLLNQIDDLYSRYRNTRIEFLIKDYRGQCTTIGKRVTATTSKGSITGRAYDIAPNGALIIMDDGNAKHEFVEGSLKIVP
ncbi:MAG: biotin--[acetyl-CoA-carboxylase] ligase [Methanobacteriota archaeon]|nr:MAG: biotin--[acetyl-CoA-carboxylase] ligase [Euryarchaeota archaeon]